MECKQRNIRQVGMPRKLLDLVIVMEASIASRCFMGRSDNGSPQKVPLAVRALLVTAACCPRRLGRCHSRIARGLFLQWH